jgi:hypothetical protein
MKQGMIAEIVQKQAKSLITTSGVAFLLCIIVFGLNWKYLFNWVAGPVPFTAALAANPGIREFVFVKGELHPTGYAQESTLKLKGAIPLSKSVTAEYVTMQIEGRKLLIKTAPDFAGTAVEGRLVPVPTELSQGLHPETGFYPWMVAAQTGYRWDFNLFVLGAVIVFPFALLFFLLFLWRGANLERNPAIKELAPFGPPLQVIEQIEKEVATTGEHGEVGPLFFTLSWLLVTEPLLKILAVKEIVGIGKTVSFKKGGAESVHSLVIWLKGKALREKFDLGDAVAAAAMQKIADLYPWLVVANPKEFAEKWASNRAACEQEAADRQKARVGP